MCLSITIIVVGNISITTCNRVLKSGPRIYVDFNKINQTCECTVTSGFDGDLLVKAETLTIPSCNTKVVVNGSHRFGCPISQGASVTFKLSLDQSINVQAEYSTPSSPGTFYQCLGFQENGNRYIIHLLLLVKLLDFDLCPQIVTQ